MSVIRRFNPGRVGEYCACPDCEMEYESVFKQVRPLVSGGTWKVHSFDPETGEEVAVLHAKDVLHAERIAQMVQEFGNSAEAMPLLPLN